MPSLANKPRKCQASKSSDLPLVSVITPSYNSMPFIIKTIESISSQDYPAIEHIVYDGASNDGTQQFLEDSSHVIWVSEQDRGQSDALNKGFRRARGEIISWLNADDTYQPGAISFAVNFFMRHQDIDVIYSDVNVIDEFDNVINISRSEPYSINRLLVANYIKQPTVFMRRKVIEQLGGVNEHLHYVMDWELWLRAGIQFKFSYIPDQIFANFRLYPGTKSYDKVSDFGAEWIMVLEQALQNPSFASLHKMIEFVALPQAQARYHLGEVGNSIKQQKRMASLRHLAKAAKLDWKLIFNPGFFLFAFQILSLRSSDRTRKYRLRRK